MKIHHCNSQLQLSSNAADALLRFFKTHPEASLGLVGGRAVESMLQQLLDRVEPRGLLWKVRIGQLDDFVPFAARPESNQMALRRLFLEPACSAEKFQAQHVHLIDNSSDEALRRAEAGYRGVLKSQFGGRFDAVVVSGGEDGHIAGLFPDRPAMFSCMQPFAVEETAPKAPSLRLTATPLLFKKVRFAVVLFAGEAKWAAFQTYRSPNSSPVVAPARILDDVPELEVFTDAPAAAG